MTKKKFTMMMTCGKKAGEVLRDEKLSYIYAKYLNKLLDGVKSRRGGSVMLIHKKIFLVYLFFNC